MYGNCCIMKTKPRVPKTKEQIIADLRNNAEWTSKMKFVKESLFPALCKATTSIEDALSNLSIINTVILEKFLARMKTVKMKEIDIYSNLSKDDPQYEGLKTLLNLFDDMSINDAKELLEGMRSEINLFLQEEQKTRTLDSLPTKWLDDLTK